MNDNLCTFVVFLQVKCHQYYPCGSVNGGEDVMVFDDVDLRVRFLTVDQMGYYNVSTLEIEDIRVSYEGLFLRDFSGLLNETFL